MKLFAIALIVASAQAIRSSRPGDDKLGPWNPPPREVAQNVYHPAPTNRENEPVIHNSVAGPIEAKSGSSITLGNPNSDLNKANNNMKGDPDHVKGEPK